MLRIVIFLVCLFATLSSVAREVEIQVDGRPYYVVAADFNGDGYRDLIVSGATFYGDAIPYEAFFLSFYEGHRDGSFSLYARITTGRSLIASLSVGDINNNGFEDLVTPLEVFFDPGLVGFVNRRPVPVLPHVLAPYQAATGDFNGDGRDDFAIADIEQRSISFFTYDDDLRWVASVPVSHYPNSLIAVDVDGDGISDVVTGASKGTVSIVYVRPEFRFREVQTVPAGIFLQDIAAASLNEDSFRDIVALDQEGTAFVYSNGPDAISVIHEFRGMGRAFSVVADDVTGDGTSDVVVGQSSGFLYVFEFDGGGDVKRRFVIHAANSASELSAADMDGDGFQDLLIADGSLSRVILLYGPLAPPSPGRTRRRAVRQ